MRLAVGNIAETTGDHDRLVVAAHDTVLPLPNTLFIAAEVTGQIRTAEFVVERRGADRPFQHDVERRGNARRAPVRRHVGFPRLRRIGQVEIGDREAAQPGLGLGAAPGRAFVADLAAGAGRRPRERRNRRRMVMRLNLGQDMREFLAVSIGTVGTGIKAFDFCALEHRGVVGINHHVAFRMGGVCLANHAEQRFLLRFAVDDPRGVENLVPAMF